jgi:hypothetical protein
VMEGRTRPSIVSTLCLSLSGQSTGRRLPCTCEVEREREKESVRGR